MPEETVDLEALTAAADDPTDLDPEAPTLPDDFDMGPLPWHGYLVAEGIPTGDKRMFGNESLTWDRLPLPFAWQRSDAPGHDGAVVIGRIDNIERVESTQNPGTFLLKADGVFYDGNAEALEVVDLIGQQMLRGVSVDVDAAEWAFQDDNGNAFDLQDADESDTPTQVFSKGRVRSAAVCRVQAYAEAFIALGPWEDPLADDPVSEDRDIEDAMAEPDRLTSQEVQQFAPGTRDGPGWITHPVPTQRITQYWVTGPGRAKIGWGAPNDFYRCRRQLAKYVQNPNWLNGLCANLHKRALGIWPGEHDGKMSLEDTVLPLETVDCTDCMDSLVASATGTPTEWFLDPNLAEPTPLTVTDDGRVFGHVAAWGTCHIGIDGACITPPKSYRGYVDFHTHPWQTDAGVTQVGYLTMNTGHAGLSMSASETMAHYDNTGTAFAAVRAGEDDHGIWVAGVMLPGLSEREQVLARSAALSGDWRTRGGHLELVAALAVNVPGFPIPQPALAAAGHTQTALVASAVVKPKAQPLSEESVAEAVQRGIAAYFTAQEEQRIRTERMRRAAQAKASARALRAQAARARLEG